MHATRNAHIISHSKPCLCKNCVYDNYKRESSKDVILHGSKIDQLYYDKYLPLREKKLIDKLVRTRAVYDNIRDRILDSDSESYDNCGCVNKKNSNNLTRNNPIHEIVGLVDRGQLSSLNSSVNLHGECCSCCDCTEKFKKEPKIHKHIPSREVIEEYLSKHKVKKFKSHSCLCPLKLSSEKNRLKYEQKHLKPILKAHKTVQESPIGLDENKQYTPITCDCFEKNQGSVVSVGTVHDVKESVQSSTSIMTTKFQNLKQDSITLYNNKKTRKIGSKEDWACAPDFCVPGHCYPPDCYDEILRSRPHLDHPRKIRFPDEKIQTKKVKKNNTKASPKQNRKKQKNNHLAGKIHTAGSSTNMSSAKTTATHKSSNKTKSASSTDRSKRTRTANTPLPFPRECDPDMCKRGKCDPEECAEILLRNTRAAHKFSSVECACEIKSKQNVVAKVRSVQKDIARCFCTLDLKKNLQKEPKPEEYHLTDDSISSTSTQSLKPPPKMQTRIIKRRRARRRLVRVSSSFTFNIEFIRENYPETKKQIKPTKAPKRCYCALKLHEAAIKKMKSKSSITCECSDYMKILSSADTNTDIVQNITDSTTTSGTSVAVTCKCSESESKKNQTIVKRCFCTKDYYEKKRKKEEIERKKQEKAENKITQTKKKNSKQKELLPYECEPQFCVPGKCDAIICEERIQIRPKKQYHSLVHRCLCTLNLNIKPKMEKPKMEKPKKVKPKKKKPKKVKPNPIDAKTIETQTIKVKHKKVIKPKEPKKPKKRRSTYCYPSGYRDSYNSLESDLQPCKTKKRNQKCGCLDSGDSQPSQSVVRLSSGVSFNIEISRNYDKSKNTNEDGHGRGDHPNAPLAMKFNLSGQLLQRNECMPIK